MKSGLMVLLILGAGLWPLACGKNLSPAASTETVVAVYPTNTQTPTATITSTLTISATPTATPTATVTATNTAVYPFYGDFGGTLSIPAGVALDLSGNIYVVDTGNEKLNVYTPSGGFSNQWTGAGLSSPLIAATPDPANDFSSANYTAVDSSGNVYVTSSGNFRVEKYNSSGNFLTAWSLGLGDAPMGIAVDSLGSVYVAANPGVIYKFASDGTQTNQWSSLGASGSLHNPAGVAVDSSGNVYVADTPNNRVAKFTGGGTFITVWGTAGSGAGEFSDPTGIAVDGSGNVLVSDRGNNRVEKFTSTGTYLASWGVSDPQGIAVNAQGYVYVANQSNQVIDVYSPD